MTRNLAWAALCGAVVLTGCQSTAQMMATAETQAVQEATNRGRFEMNCPAATGTVLSKDLMQPAIQTIRFSGPERGEFTIGVSGCGQRTTYLVICPLDGSGCFPVGTRNIIRQ
ncbi:MAG: hypothetical protein ACREBN_05650 [Burkholderiaceae bacterium]